jgi:hypothetical protein
MVFYGKIKWILGILMVFILVIATNLIDRHSFVSMRDSVVSIYEDRIVANDLIFEMAYAFHEKEMAMVTNDSTFFIQRNDDINAEIEGFIVRFEQTKLTLEESQIFEKLKRDFGHLKDSEETFVQSHFDEKKALIKDVSRFKESLFTLSKIQLNEGARQANIGKRAINTVELFTQIEIYLLIALAVVIQIIVMYKPKETE